jgi:phosphatidate cytidylyltransferase
MKTRILTGIPAALAVVALLWVGSMGLLRVVSILLGIFAYLEFDTLMFSKKSPGRRALMGILVAFQMFLFGSDPISAFHGFTLSIILILASAILSEARRGNFEVAVKNVALELMGFIYINFLFGFLYSIVSWPNFGRRYLILLFLMVFVGDTAAYFGGTKFGKRKLATQISPKKTIEGAFSAVLASVLVTLIWVKWICPEPIAQEIFWKLVILSVLISVLAQAGDLFESVLKRSQLQKDSGTFLPGHGGILDRVDGLAFTSPVFYMSLQYFLEIN